MNRITPEQKQQYFEILKELLEEGDPTPETTTLRTAQEPVHVFTDGSGSRGRCSSSTPAGWGWCYRQDEAWIEAYGPVVTQPDHNAYTGAQVGSNNTGEVTAIIEGILYSQQQGFTNLHIHSDSQWAINVIKGRWRPQRHKTLVNFARDLLNILGHRTQLH